MIILSHRGYWKKPEEKNNVVAFNRSFDLGFGTETDVRDRLGDLVISHDMAGEDAITLPELLEILNERALPLALNIKSDGLADLLAKKMRDVNPRNWFTFDMSVPDMRHHLRVGNPVFARLSEAETITGWMEAAEGVWLDAFESDSWYQVGMVEDLLNRGKRVCIVSPELHGRQHLDLWRSLHAIRENSSLMLCSDFPEDAKRFFESED